MSATTSERPDVHALAVCIARHLSDTRSTWTAEPKDEYHHGTTLRRDDGGALWISVDHTGRAECSGRFPQMASGTQYSAGKDDYGRIGFDPTKDPKKIADDIERRCLPVYLAALEKARVYITRDSAAREAALSAARAIATATGADAKEAVRQTDRDGAVNVWPEVEGCYDLQVRPSSEHNDCPRVDMKLRDVHPCTAIAVLELLKQAAEKCAAP